MKILQAVKGPLVGTSYKLDGSATIGRDGECDIQVIRGGVSRRHACLTEHDDGSVVLSDLRSRNGTRVGGLAARTVRLAPGDRFEVGDSTFELREIDDGSVTADYPDIKLTSGPAMNATIRDDIRTVQLAALIQANRAASPAPCCDRPIAAEVRASRQSHCPDCGTRVA